MVEFVVEDQKLHCLFSGHLDTIEAMKMEGSVEVKIAQSRKPVVFDMRNARYICSGFIRICVRAVKSVGRDHFSIIHADPTVAKTLKIAGFEPFVKPS